jgi:hypothetical protein
MLFITIASICWHHSSGGSCLDGPTSRYYHAIKHIVEDKLNLVYYAIHGTSIYFRIIIEENGEDQTIKHLMETQSGAVTR